jgi:hypothetical protein
LFHRDKPSGTSRATRARRSDLIIAAVGLALGFGCAAFPWYIFLHQEKFGIQPLSFSGNPKQNGSIPLGSDGELPGISPNEIPPMKLDLFATGTVAPYDDEDGVAQAIDDQPFPGPEIDYRLVYAGNGRAMIADDSGLWVVHRGSILPDNSKVASIEQRGKKWVLVTSKDKVIELSTQ